jgi:hypothetical protein
MCFMSVDWQSFSPVAQQPNSGPRRLIVEVSRLHTHSHTHTNTLLCTSDQLVVQVATYTTHYKHKTRTFMSSARLELVVPALKRPQSCALDRLFTVWPSTSIHDGPPTPTPLSAPLGTTPYRICFTNIKNMYISDLNTFSSDPISFCCSVFSFMSFFHCCTSRHLTR